MTEAILYLSREDVEAVLPPIDQQIGLVRQAWNAMASGDVQLPPKPSVEPRSDGFLHAMPAYVGGALDLVGFKWVAGYATNKARGLPYITGLIVLSDADTGLVIAVLDGEAITAARTAAVSGACVERLAPPGWRRAGILGCGVQGRSHAAMLRAVQPAVDLVAYDPHPERVAQLAPGAQQAQTPAAAVDGADVVVTAGPIGRDPRRLLGPDRFSSPLLLLPVDMDSYVAKETIRSMDLLLVDDVSQFDHYRQRGFFQGWREPEGNVYDWPGEVAPDARVACVNLGLGSVDLVFAADVAAAARQKGRGQLLRR
jgi:ornithine cyclodeaminase/alanine dehydrogenase